MRLEDCFYFLWKRRQQPLRRRVVDPYNATRLLRGDVIHFVNKYLAARLNGARQRRRRRRHTKTHTSRRSERAARGSATWVLSTHVVRLRQRSARVYWTVLLKRSALKRNYYPTSVNARAPTALPITIKPAIRKTSCRFTCWPNRELGVVRR